MKHPIAQAAGCFYALHANLPRMKDFDGWNEQKKRLERFGKESLEFFEQEIWWCAIGINIGHEQDGKHGVYERPVLILKKFNATTAWVIPISSKVKEGYLYYVFNLGGNKQTLLLSQLRLVSTKRLRRRIGRISLEQRQDIRRTMRNFLS